jgi:hypothetical protein
MTAIAKGVLEVLAPLFAALLLLTIMMSGLVMMIAPAKAREILKNAAIAAAIFLFGLTLAQSCIEGLR